MFLQINIWCKNLITIFTFNFDSMFTSMCCLRILLGLQRKSLFKQYFNDVSSGVSWVPIRYIFFLTIFTFNFSNQRVCSLCFLRVTGEPTIFKFQNIFHMDLLYGSQNLYWFWRYVYKFYIKLRMYLFYFQKSHFQQYAHYVSSGVSLVSILLESPFWCIFL